MRRKATEGNRQSPLDNSLLDPPHDPAGDLPVELQQTARRYASQPVPRPSSKDTAQLTQRLLAEAAFQAQYTHGDIRLPGQVRVIARWRFYLLGPWLWVAGVVLLAVGAMLARFVSVDDLVALVILVLPLNSVLGLMYALRTPSAGLRAVEATCPVNFAQTTMALVLVIIAFDGLLGLVATLGIALVSITPFWNLLLAWLAPVLLLTAISLPVALLRGVRLAALIGGVPWLFLGLFALGEQNGQSFARVLFSVQQDPFSLLCQLLAIGISVLLLLALMLLAPKWQYLRAF